MAEQPKQPTQEAVQEVLKEHTRKAFIKSVEDLIKHSHASVAATYKAAGIPTPKQGEHWKTRFSIFGEDSKEPIAIVVAEVNKSRSRDLRPIKAGIGNINHLVKVTDSISKLEDGSVLKRERTLVIKELTIEIGTKFFGWRKDENGYEDTQTVQVIKERPALDNEVIEINELLEKGKNLPLDKYGGGTLE